MRQPFPVVKVDLRPSELVAYDEDCTSQSPPQQNPEGVRNVQEMPTERIHEEMSQVIAEGGGLATVARAVDALNLSLAHHAAWTNERFDKVDERFDKVDQRLDRVELRLDGLEVGHGRLSLQVDTLSARVGGLERKVDSGLARLDEKIDSSHARLEEKIDRMSARVEEVLAFATRQERRADRAEE